ncbi:MAG: TonB-dependent receptor plug domain-containing protein, partial [Thermodesulfobacteriota bacterium]|nr:TonB-dependent receptor plug domain-containing protein [Thermodesulfobacteriota bacterium]
SLIEICSFRNVCVAALVIASLWFCPPVIAGTLPDEAEETLLMFVGETEPVVTVASRSPESPTTAPAMVTLVDRQQIERHGYHTLGELLADQPGFFTTSGGRGTVLHLRGMRDAILFLYDGVPITTDVTKSFVPLDLEFSLAAVDHVEIITGPGSVLWGSDAFAAVINLVPLRAYQQPGVAFGLTAGTQYRQGGALSWGYSNKKTDLFLYATTGSDRFYDHRYDIGSGQYDEIDNSRYTELVGTLKYRDWLYLSGRWSDFERNFTMQDAPSGLIWDGSKSTPFNYLKLSLTANHGASHYSLNSFVQETDYLLRDADIERRQTNRSLQTELLWDRRVWQRGLMTVGAAWRYNQVKGALIRDGFQPDFLLPDEPLFVPEVEQADFSSDVLSVFGQFRYRWGHSEWWIGGRLEDHSDYDKALTGSMGVYVPLGDELHFKLTYGGAFRTPYSSQLFDSVELEQEEIGTLSGRLSWDRPRGDSYAITLFHSRLDHHRSEDPYGGLSLESTRDVYGAEFEFDYPLTPSLTASAWLSWHGGDAACDSYRVLAYSIITPGGDRYDFYENWSQSGDQSPEWLAGVTLDWSLAAHQNLLATVTAGSDVSACYSKATITEHYDTPILVSLVYNRPGFFRPQNRISLRITNLLDQDYQQPDVYGPVDGAPLSLVLTWIFKF